MTKKVLMVIAKADFRDEEYVEPRKIFEQANFEIKVAASQRGACVGKLGLETWADLDLDQVSGSDYDGVVFIGGPGAAKYANDPIAWNIAKQAHQAGRVVAAICMAPEILANAGLLSGRQATASESSVAAIEAKGAKYIDDQPVVKDDKIITASGPAAAIRFGEVIRDELLK